MFIEQPAKWLRWLYPKAIWRMDKKDHSVYLTFDDGPIPESTPFILETLRKYNIKATFFMVGRGSSGWQPYIQSYRCLQAPRHLLRAQHQ